MPKLPKEATPTKPPRFSIIVPAYNVENYISECIDSVLAQDFQDYELILIDDGSTDRTSKICDQYQNLGNKNPNRHPQSLPHTSTISQNNKKVKPKITRPAVKVLHQPNSGLSAARNAGVAIAGGEYLIFLDGDDYLTSSALSTIQCALQPELDLLRYQAQEVFPDGNIIRHSEAGFAALPPSQAFPKLSHYHYIENAWLYAYRRAFFVEHHFQYAVGRLAEDFGLTPLIIAQAKTIKSIPDICYNYRQRAGSIMHDSKKLSRRTDDMFKQLQTILPKLATIPHAKPISHYLVVSFLSGAVALDRTEFLKIYQAAKQSGMLSFVRPSSLKALPRSLALKYFPGLFYRLYHH